MSEARSRISTMALAMGLLYIDSGCSFRIVGLITGCAKQTVQMHVRTVLKVLSQHVFFRVVKFPNETQAIMADFLARCYIPGVIGAIDGTHIPIFRP